MNKKKIFTYRFIFLFIVCHVFLSCGSRVFTQGIYQDAQKIDLLDDSFNESDVQALTEGITSSLSLCLADIHSFQKPLVILDHIHNRTTDHIDTLALIEKMRYSLLKTKTLQLIHKEERQTLAEEYQYQKSDAISPDLVQKQGKQKGADYILTGVLTSHIQEVDNEKIIFYRLNMNLTHLETSTIDCIAEKEIKKKYKKPSFVF